MRGDVQLRIAALKTRGAGCLIAFATPFAALGVFALGLAISRFLEPGHDPRQAFGALAAGIAFSVAGGGLIAAGIAGSRRARASDALRAEHPASPWMWRPEWSTGRIPDLGRGNLIYLWLFAILWNAIALPMMLFLPDVTRAGNKAALIGLIFPVAGAGLLIAAVTTSLRLRRFRVSHFRMSPLPGALGGRVAGQVETTLGREVLGNSVVLVTLSCVRRTTSGGKSNSTTESVLWQEDAEHPAAVLPNGPTGIVIPVSFIVPADLPPSSVEPGSSAVLWRLLVHADVPGVDYDATFEIPVFATGEDAEPRAIAAHAARTNTLPPYVSVTRQGELWTIVVDAPRPTSALVSLGLFILLWNGAIALMIALGVPMFFVVITGIFDLIMLLAFIDMLSSRTTTTIDDGWVTVGKRRVLRSDVTEVEPKINMSSGRTGARHNVWYAVEVRTKIKRKLIVAIHLRNKRHAEAIAEKVKELIHGPRLL